MKSLQVRWLQMCSSTTDAMQCNGSGSGSNSNKKLVSPDHQTDVMILTGTQVKEGVAGDDLTKDGW